MPEPLSREEALRVLALATTADVHDVKRAYRRLARQHHPDLGGDPEVFQELQQAYERLADDAPTPRPPKMARGRPSRPRPTFTDGPPPADVTSIDWSVQQPATGARLDRDRFAAALYQRDGDHVASMTATSRSPGSRFNAFAPHLAGTMTCDLRVSPDTDDRGRAVVSVEVRAWNRRSRRVLERAELLGHWARIRGSSSTLLRTSLVPAREPRATVVRTVDRTEELLDRLDWPLPAWTMTSLLR